MKSAAQALIARVALLGPEAAGVALNTALDQLSVLELAALSYDWNFWARPNQVLPVDDWRSHGFLTARRVGKTRSNSEFVNREAVSGRAMRIGFAAQNEDKTIEVMVFGDCGLIATSPPWFKARWESGRVIWPNGAQAFPFTPEVPGSIRGPGVHLFWASELQSWPVSTREEAFYNAQLMTSLGYARTIWEATPKNRHPLIRLLLKRAAEKPDEHRVVRGTIDENADNLGQGVVASLRDAMDGTQRGREELDGHYQEEDDEALWKQAWIDDNRRPMPPREEFLRRVIVIDPAIGTKEDSDSTGMGELGLLTDGQILIIEDLTGKHEADAWAELALDRYIDGQCDLIIAETNRGGNLVVQNLRAVAEKRTLRIVVVDDKWKPHCAPGVVFVREVNAKKSKAMRAAPVATLAKNGRVSHRIGANLDALETLMTTWVPPPEGTRSGGRRSPDSLDAVVHGAVELAGLSRGEKKDPKAGFVGVEQVSRKLTQMTAPGSSPAPSMLSSFLLPRGGGGSRI